MYLLGKLVILYLCVGPRYCFFGRKLKDGNPLTKTHKDITFDGALNAITRYIAENKGSSSMEEFFKDDDLNYVKMRRKIHRLGATVADTQEERRSKSYYHCNANQIDLAHNFVKSCKIKLRIRRNNINAIRRQIGECLYTIQSFYSNTNWIEMSGEMVYQNFGRSDIMAVASADDNACQDMGSPSLNCKDNIKITDKLISGYHSSRGSRKPPRSIQSTTYQGLGPCSHGGPGDKSRYWIAKCGINKDSATELWSPHYHLHEAAYRAAIAATEEFLIGNDTGIVQTLGEDIFDELFNIKLKKDVSLAFAVDFSGSMTDDIAAVKRNIIRIVYSTMGTDYEPADYVLSLFNDPVSWHQDFVFTSGTDMITKIQSIRATGGADCPEYAATGILKAIELAKPGSTVLTFTDASAKDASRISEVLTAALSKNMILTSLLTGTCSKRRKRALIGRDKRSTDTFYQQLADETGGKVYSTNKNDLDTILSQVLEGIFPTSGIIIDSYSWPSSSTIEMPIIVDSAVTVLTISVIGAASVDDVDIYYENGTLETFTSATSNRIYTGSGEIIISIQNPPPSTLNLTRNVNNNWSVNVTGQSSLKAEVELLQYTSDENLISVQGSPVLGYNYSVSWTMYNLGSNGTCDSMSTVFQNGKLISSYPLSTHETNYSLVCSADIDLPEEQFKLKLTGIDNDGYPFSRKISTTFQPSFVELTILVEQDEVLVDQETSIGFDIKNVGEESKTYQVSITDSHGFLLTPTSRQYTIDGGESANGTFVVKPTTASIVITYAISVTDQVTGVVQLTVTKTLGVTDIERPVCSVYNSTGICEDSTLDAANCSQYTWTAMAEVTFSGTTLHSISNTAGSAVVLIHDNITNLLSGPVIVNITGDCCFPTVQINAIDADGFIGQCKLQFTDGEDVRSAEVASSPGKILDVPLPVVAIIAGVLSGTVVTTVVIIGIYFYNRPNKKMKIHDSKQNVSQDTGHTWTDFFYISVKPDNNRRPVFKMKPKTMFNSEDVFVEDLY